MLVPGGIVGNAGGPYKTLNGAMNIHRADVHRQVINDYMHVHGTITTLAVAVSKGDVDITVVSAVGFTAGDYVHFGTIPATIEPIHPQITNIAVNVITLDRPIDFDYIIGTDIAQAIMNMASVAGATLAVPLSYKYFPQVGRIEHIRQILLSMDHSTAGADDLFGGIAALTNGVVFRAQINNQIGTFTNWKTNSDIKLDVGAERVIYAAKSGPGDFGTSARGSFSDLDVAIRLDNAVGDFLEILIQDTLITDLVNFRIKVQGHIEGL